MVALGGNALLRRGEKPDARIQLAHVRAAAQSLAPLANDHELLICHGNGPQVGMLALESEDDRSLTRPYPLDVLVALTQGMIGYWLAQTLRDAGVTKPVIALVTQTQVDVNDPAFATPTKFVGPIYTRDQAQHLAALHGWQVAPDGDHWRRVVPSPAPQRIVEQESITHLLAARTVVICGGGGGAPVIDDGTGHLTGVEAVVDKDFTAALIAIAVHADRLLVLTDVSAVMANYGTPQATPRSHLDLDELARLTFPAGSMAPKMDACRHFVEATGHPATIGALNDASALLAGTTGTTISIPGSSTGEDLPGRRSGVPPVSLTPTG